MLVFIGTYTNAKSKGIYAFRMDGATGALTPIGLVAETASPSFLAIHPNRKFLYAANEVESFGGEKAGAVTAFAIDAATGKLTALNQQSSRGAAPCHLVVDKSGKSLLVANYTGGNVAVLPVGADGKLGPASGFVQHQGKSVDAGRQEGPHAHSFNLSPDNRFAFAADLGLDKVLIYRFDAAKSSITPNEPAAGVVPPGSGPRHFAFHPSGRYAYVINEMKSTVTVFDYEGSKGALRAKQTLSTLPAGFTGNTSTAEVQVHPSGRFLYGSNRGHDSIAIFAIDPTNGQLTHLGNESTQGKTPRNFGIDPTGNFLIAANQGSDSLVVFRIDQKTGKLQPTGVKVEAPVPVCVKFLPID
ncbi:MAG: lactonase family protein [Actinomycetota bacterium]